MWWCVNLDMTGQGSLTRSSSESVESAWVFGMDTGPCVAKSQLSLPSHAPVRPWSGEAPSCRLREVPGGSWWKFPWTCPRFVEGLGLPSQLPGKRHTDSPPLWQPIQLAHDKQERTPKAFQHPRPVVKGTSPSTFRGLSNLKHGNNQSMSSESPARRRTGGYASHDGLPHLFSTTWGLTPARGLASRPLGLC